MCWKIQPRVACETPCQPGLLKEVLGHPIKPAHLLDCPVSCVVCCGITNKDTKRLSRRIELGETSKTYVARGTVPSGGLPSLPLTIQNPLLFDKANSIAFVVSMNNKNRGKFSKTTIMECLHVFDIDNSSVVFIRILSGRKYQIRIDLQQLGLPIANDVLYGGVGKVAISAFGKPDPPTELVEIYENEQDYATVQTWTVCI
jgi:23S rRNA-/tRNA-specific pseudouridylate synthase